MIKNMHSICQNTQKKKFTLNFFVSLTKVSPNFQGNSKSQATPSEFFVPHTKRVAGRGQGAIVWTGRGTTEGSLPRGSAHLKSGPGGAAPPPLF